MWHVWVTGRVHTGFWWGNLIGKRSLIRRRRKWENNIRMDATEIDWDAVDRIDLARDGDNWRPAVNVVMNLRFHKMREISWLVKYL
jgi:hypothetical protein